MNQKQQLDSEFQRFQDKIEQVREMPPSDERAALFMRLDKIKNYIVFTDKLIAENKDVGVIIDRIHQLITDLI